ncbi:MAG: hypothetical protein DRN12_05980 [Thermoplasmata archaeon]|nr:MAG: hypothetical protein DRN12_05980 [Thermoplasmata archaeon]
MTKAIENKLGLKHSQAQKLASFIMDTFGYESRIIDNVLNPEERQLFYMLQSEGLLSAGREQTRLHDGREWLTYYWEIEDKAILYYAHKQMERRKRSIFKTSPKNIYESLPEDIWMMRKAIRNMYS